MSQHSSEAPGNERAANEHPVPEVPASTATADATPFRDAGGTLGSPLAKPPWWRSLGHQLGPSLFVLVVFGLIVMFSPGLRQQVLGSTAEAPEVLGEAVQLLDQNFFRADLDNEEMFRDAIRGMVDSLGDPHTSYMGPRRYAEFTRDTRGRFPGLGIQLVLDDDDLPMVFTPFPDTPAYRAGLRPGDRILRVDGNETRGEPFSEVVVDQWLRGEAGTAVTLDIRDRNGRERAVEVERGHVRVPSVAVSRMLDEHDAVGHGMGYLRIDQFQSGTTEDVAARIERMKADGLEVLVLDMRGNRGGLLREAQHLAGLFLPLQSLVAFTRGRNPEMQRAYTAEGENAGRFLDLGLFVLIDRDTASASEIVAGALQDHQRALVIGEHSHGKGTVQNVYELGDGGERHGAIRITTARYFTPSGRVIQRADPYRVCPTSGNRYPATEEFQFSPVTGEPLEDDPATHGEGYRGGILPDVSLPLTDEEYGHHRQVRRHEAVYGGEAEWVGAAKEYRDKPFNDRHLEAAITLANGASVAQAVAESTVEAGESDED